MTPLSPTSTLHGKNPVSKTAGSVPVEQPPIILSRDFLQLSVNSSPTTDDMNFEWDIKL